MPKLVLAVICLAIVAGGSSAQRSPKPESEAAQTNPCDAANTQMEMNQCSADEYKKADAHLNAVYTKLIRVLQKDTGNAEQQSGGEQRKPETPAVDKLKAAQRQWIRYRDLHCGAVRAQFEGGTTSPMMWTACMTEATDHRIAELKHGYEIGDVTLD
jgi:uncharacterized protein YecT (DUF1311 family)